MAKSGCNVHVLNLAIENSTTLFKKEITSFKDEAGISTTQILIQSRFYKLLHVLLPLHYRAVKKLFIKLNADLKIDIIHSHVLYPAAILGYKLSKEFLVPHIITEHWSKVNQFMNKSLYAGLGKKTYLNADAVTTVSEFLEQSISSYLKPAKTFVVPNVINTSLFNYKEKTNHTNTLRFSMVAHWLPPKRPDLIFKSIEAFSYSINKKISLTVIGEGKLLDVLKTEKWNFEIQYAGNKPADKLATLLHETDFFLHASDIETFSIVIAEALSTGTPVLASHVGAISELINPEVGVLTKNTIDDWVNGLNILVNSSYNHQHIAEATKKYSPEIIGEQFKKIYVAITT